MAEWQASRYPDIQVSSAGASLEDLIPFNSIAIIDVLSCPKLSNFVPPEVGRCLKGNCLRGVLWSPAERSLQQSASALWEAIMVGPQHLRQGFDMIWWLWNVVNLNCLVTFFLLQESVDWKCIRKRHLVRHAQALKDAKPLLRYLSWSLGVKLRCESVRSCRLWEHSEKSGVLFCWLDILMCNILRQFITSILSALQQNWFVLPLWTASLTVAQKP